MEIFNLWGEGEILWGLCAKRVKRVISSLMWMSRPYLCVCFHFYSARQQSSSPDDVMIIEESPTIIPESPPPFEVLKEQRSSSVPRRSNSSVSLLRPRKEVAHLPRQGQFPPHKEVLRISHQWQVLPLPPPKKVAHLPRRGKVLHLLKQLQRRCSTRYYHCLWRSLLMSKFLLFFNTLVKTSDECIECLDLWKHW